MHAQTYMQSRQVSYFTRRPTYILRSAREVLLISRFKKTLLPPYNLFTCFHHLSMQCNVIAICVDKRRVLPIMSQNGAEMCQTTCKVLLTWYNAMVAFYTCTRTYIMRTQTLATFYYVSLSTYLPTWVTICATICLNFL